MIFAGENLLFLVFEAFHFRQDPKQNLSALLNGSLGCVTEALYDVSKDQRRQLREQVLSALVWFNH